MSYASGPRPLCLARFNVAAEAPSPMPWRRGYFTGIPAPAGAFLALVPIYAVEAGLLDLANARTLALVATPVIALLMVSRWPTFSGKLIRKVPKILLLPPILLGFAAAASFVAWPWETLAGAGVLYAATLPLSRWRHKRHMRTKGI
jgi:CDP-diacylglycerol--serine O-phosphatidyltransferase